MRILRLARVGPAGQRQLRVCLVTLVVLGVGVAFALPQLGAKRAIETQAEIPWWMLTLLFAVAEIFVLHVQIRREARTISLSEIPLVLGLFFCSPAAFLLARVAGPALVFALHRRQAPVKLAYNVAIVFAEGAVALTVFHAVTGGAVIPGPQGWLGAYLAAAVAGGLLSGVATSTAISVYEGRLMVSGFVDAVLRGTPLAMFVATIGLVGAHALESDPSTVWLLALTAGILFAAYRTYARLSERHLALERLYDFSQAVTGTPSLRDTLQMVLAEARELLRAEEAELVLRPEGEQPIALRLSASDDSAAAAELRVDDEDRRWLLDLLLENGGTELLTTRHADPRVREFLDNGRLREAIAAPLVSEGVILGALLVSNRLGDVRTFDHDDAKLLATVANQASVALRKGQLIDQLRYEALHDPLTGLPNRSAFQRRMREALDRGVQQSDEVGVMIMDLDRFKEVNDTLGHQQGDLLLREIGSRLHAAAGADCVVGRLGGDEFGILVTGAQALERSLDVARRLLGALRRPLVLDGFELEVGASIGLALAPAHGREASELLKGADLAMYRAKASGEDIEVYDSTWEEGDPQQLVRVAELRAAIPSEQLRLYVQPMVSIPAGDVQGVEALVRWEHPALGLLPPAEFIELAERSGLVRPLTIWMIRAALERNARWRDKGIELGTAVNLSPRSLTDRVLAEDILALVRAYGLPRGTLTLEITETGVLTNPDRAIALLHDFRAAGIRLAIDDFGTGYSSLSYLKRLPIDEVKIDRSFVSALDDRESRAIVRAISDLGRGLGLRVVAEGVEDEASFGELAAAGCNAAQGFCFAAPMPADDFEPWLTGFAGGRTLTLLRRLRAAREVSVA